MAWKSQQLTARTKPSVRDKHGILDIIKNNGKGPIVAFRYGQDFDALLGQMLGHA